MNERIEKWIKEVEGSLYGHDLRTAPTTGVPSNVVQDGLQRPLEDEPCLVTDVQAEAKDLIHSWLQQGENPSITDGCDRVPSSEVDISSAVTSIMDDLMSKPLDYSSVTREDTKWGTDPRVAMEMRHKRIKVKKQAREQAQQQVMKEEIARKEARRRATQEVMRAERELRQREKEEEKMVQLEMNRIRKQMREERERERLFEEMKSTREHHTQHRPLTSLPKKRTRRNHPTHSTQPTHPTHTTHSTHPTHSTHHTHHKHRRHHKSNLTTSAVNQNYMGHQATPPEDVAAPGVPPSPKHPHKELEGKNCVEGTLVSGMEGTHRVSSLQLAEKVSRHSQKRRLKVLHHHFVHWYTRLLTQRTSYSKATVTADWRVTRGVWRRWVGALRERREEVEMATAEAVQREQRLTSVSSSHWRKKMLSKCLSGWRRVIREENGRRQLEKEAVQRKKKMATLLHTIQSGDVSAKKQSRPPQGPALITTKMVRQELERILSEGKLKLVEDQSSVSGGNVHSHKGAVGVGMSSTGVGVSSAGLSVTTPGVGVSSAEVGVATTGEGVANSIMKPPNVTMVLSQPKLLAAMEKKAKERAERREERLAKKKEQQLMREERVINKDQVSVEGGLLNVEDDKTVPLEVKMEGSESVRTSQILSVEVPKERPHANIKATHHHHPQHPTQPATSLLTAMEQRSLDIARRKEERMKRREQLEKERLEKMREEEERKARETIEAKEAALAQRRREREQARQREVERQEKVQRARELSIRAMKHYECHLCGWGLLLWKQFVKSMKQMSLEASQFHINRMAAACMSVWLSRLQDRVCQMEEKAGVVYDDCLQRRVLRCMREHVCYRRDQLTAADQRYKLHTLSIHLKGWLMFVTEEKLRMWDVAKKAKELREKTLKAVVLKAWRKYVPMERREKLVEKRKAVLRAKVASWLQDYNPQSS